jgi:hypothetical protein
VYTAWEFVDICALSAEIEDADFGIWHTTVEAGLRVWLYCDRLSASVLAIQIRHVRAGFNGSDFGDGHASDGVPCSCSSGNTSLDDEPWRRCIRWDSVGLVNVR